MKKLRLLIRIGRTKLIYSRLTSAVYARFLYYCGLLLVLIDKRKAAFIIMRAHRNERTESWRVRCERIMLRYRLLRPAIIDSLIPRKFRHKGFYHGRVFLLKENRGEEKGVIIVKYNETFARLFNAYDIGKILKDYYLCIELSYYGFCTPEILQFERYDDTGIVIGLVHDLEERSLKRLCRNILPVYYSSSTWVDERNYYDMKIEKSYDCIMVAMWNDIKRHHLLFEAVRKMKDPTYRICLVGGPWGLVMNDIKDLAAHYGVIGNIEFFERVPPGEVNLLLNKSKVNLLLSLKEGGNKAIIEGLFANVPAIVLDEHIGIDLAWINTRTGIVTDRNHLKEVLLEMRSYYKSFQPRRWAIDNISCHASTRNLEGRLKEIAARRNEPWTTPIRKKVNRPECEYYEESMRLPPFDLERYRIRDME